MRMVLLLLVGLLLAAPATAADYAATWTRETPGIEVGRLSIPSVKDGIVEITAVRVDPARHQIRIVDVPGYLHKLRYAPIAVTKIDPERDPAFKPALDYSLDEIAYAEAPEVLINGGFKGDDAYNLPTGLLIVEGKTISRLNSRSSTQSGIVCLGDQDVSIIWRKDFREDRCRYALQSGPLIIDPGSDKPGINRGELDLPAFRRTFACVERSGHLVLAVTTETHLYDLAVALAEARAPLQLDCAATINLSGSIESGLYVREDIVGGTDGPLRIGATMASLASALAVTRRVETAAIEPAAAATAGVPPLEDPEKQVSERTLEAIGEMINDAMEVVTERAVTPQQRDDNLVSIVKQGFDLDYVIRFVLGRHRDAADAATFDALRSAYATWLVRSYLYSLDELICASEGSNEPPDFKAGKVLRTGDEGDIRVSTVLTLPRSGDTYDIGWIVREAPEDRVRVINVEIEGVSMLVSQRSEFSEILRQGGVDRLVSVLRDRAAKTPLPRCMPQ